MKVDQKPAGLDSSAASSATQVSTSKTRPRKEHSTRRSQVFRIRSAVKAETSSGEASSDSGVGWHEPQALVATSASAKAVRATCRNVEADGV